MALVSELKSSGGPKTTDTAPATRTNTYKAFFDRIFATPTLLGRTLLH